MDIVWQQILTHMLGFLLVVWLLKKFAWGPLLSMIEERRENIVSEFREIEFQKKDLEKQRHEYDDKVKEIEQERRQKLLEGVNEGQKIAAELKATAQGEAKEIITKAREESAREVIKAKAQLKKDMVTITMSAAEKLLREKLTDDRDRQLVGDFIDQIDGA
ncbi:MAG TPA: F0F1 ATP synthase subunit B [candidate division Zixibacteria bacterium]|nr:F0F1 ATP synthase subunit B [candidate division Zixibacteria bacterium]